MKYSTKWIPINHVFLKNKMKEELSTKTGLIHPQLINEFSHFSMYAKAPQSRLPKETPW